MYDPLVDARELNAAYGLRRLSLDDRAGAVSLVTQKSAAVAELTEQLMGALWSLLTSLESGADDEVLHEDLVRVVQALAGELHVLYRMADLLGVAGLYEVMARTHRCHLNPGGGVFLGDLVALPRG